MKEQFSGILHASFYKSVACLQSNVEILRTILEILQVVMILEKKFLEFFMSAANIVSEDIDYSELEVFPPYYSDHSGLKLKFKFFYFIE